MNINFSILQFKNREFLFIPITLAILSIFIFPQLAEGEETKEKVRKLCEDASKCAKFDENMEAIFLAATGVGNLSADFKAELKKPGGTKAGTMQKVGPLIIDNEAKAFRIDSPTIGACDPVLGFGCWEFGVGASLDEGGIRDLVVGKDVIKALKFNFKVTKPAKTKKPKKSDGEEGSEQEDDKKDEKKDDKESGVKFGGRPTSKGGCGSVSIALAGKIEACGEVEFPKPDPRNLRQSIKNMSTNQFIGKGVRISHELKIGKNAGLNSTLDLFRDKKPVYKLEYRQKFSTGKELLCGLIPWGTDYCRRVTTFVVIDHKPESKTDLIVDIKPGSKTIPPKTIPPKTIPPKSEPEPPTTTGVEDIFEIGSWEVSAAWGKNTQLCGQFLEKRAVEFSRVGKEDKFIGTTEVGKMTISRASTTAPWRIHMNNEFIIVTNSRLIERPLKFVGNITIKRSPCEGVIGTFEVIQKLTNLPKPEPKSESSYQACIPPDELSCPDGFAGIDGRGCWQCRDFDR